MVNGKPFIGIIDSSYMALLRTADSKVQQKDKRPYVANIIELNGFNYAIPFSKQIITKTGKRRNPTFTMIVSDSDGKPSSALLLNNMIPVPKECIQKYSVPSFGVDQVTSYQSRFIRSQKDLIIEKATTVYERKKSGKDSLCNQITNDFDKLEAICKQYTKGRDNNAQKNISRN